MDRRSLLDTVTTLSVSGRLDFFCVVFFYGISESVAHALKLALWVFMIGSFFFLTEQMIYPVPHQVSVAGTR